LAGRNSQSKTERKEQVSGNDSDEW